TTGGSAISPAVTVEVQDQFGNVVTTDSSNVTISISNPGVLSGSSTLIVAASSGVATYANIIPTKTGTSLTLQALDAALTTADSTAFNVTAAAANTPLHDALPIYTTGGSAISPAVTVEVQDQFGNVVTTDSSNVTISISNPGVLSGSSTLIVAAS